MRKFDVALSRMAVAGSILVTCAIAATNPYGANRLSFETHGSLGWDSGWIGISLMALMAFIAIIDVVINDMLPDRFHVNFPLKTRHLLFFLLAAGQLGLIYNNIMAGNYDALLLKYAWDAFISVLVVFADFIARHHRITREGTE